MGGEGSAESDELTPLPPFCRLQGRLFRQAEKPRAESRGEPVGQSGPGAGQESPGEGGLQTRAPPRGSLGVAVPETEIGQREPSP